MEVGLEGLLMNAVHLHSTSQEALRWHVFGKSSVIMPMIVGVIPNSEAK